MKVKHSASEISVKKKTKKSQFNSVNQSQIDNGGSVNKKKKWSAKKNKMFKNVLKLQEINDTGSLKSSSVKSGRGKSDDSDTVEHKKSKKLKKKESYISQIEQSGKSFHRPQDTADITFSNEGKAHETSSWKINEHISSTDLYGGKNQHLLKKKKNKFSSEILESEGFIKTDENHPVEKKKPKKLKKEEVINYQPH
uniref:Uncharacterized protein n=1 Tax=Graphocephala atropunctata TaxID=36148 RepID=A0A1B6LZL8_9HEMI